MYDVIVVGVGAMGSATLAELAARGKKVLGLEAWAPAHRLSSSHGDSRIIRLGYHEDPAYVPLLQRAYRNWWRMERRLGADILTQTGVLQIGRADGRLVTGTLKSCREYGLAHEMLDRQAMADRFPGFALDEDEVGVLDPAGGYIRPEAAVWGNIQLATSDGAELHIGERVSAIEPGGGGVTVRSDSASYRAKKVVVATGPWIANLVPAVAQRAVPIRQVVAWYQPADGLAAQPERMPCFLRDEGDAGSYFGFPQIGVDGVKIGKHAHFREPIDPEQSNPEVNDADTALLDGFAAHRLPEVATTRVKSVTCRYTMLPSEDFLIDLLPGEPSIVVCSACSGHGFKFTSVIGELLADLAQNGGTELPIAPFSFKAHGLAA